jgi:hypothetical protein
MSKPVLWKAVLTYLLQDDLSHYLNTLEVIWLRRFSRGCTTALGQVGCAQIGTSTLWLLVFLGWWEGFDVLRGY